VGVETKASGEIAPLVDAVVQLAPAFIAFGGCS
jgi:hypothetical protein